MISIIAAIGKNNELGKGNRLLWQIPADMKHFRELTFGHTVVMGRKTFESIGRPLPSRKNIVITRDKNYNKTDFSHGVNVTHSLEEALKISRTTLDINEEIFVIGGAEIYKQALSVVDKLYITHIDAKDKNADSFFPEIVPIVWNEVSHEEHKADEKNPIPYTFSIYERFF